MPTTKMLKTKPWCLNFDNGIQLEINQWKIWTIAWGQSTAELIEQCQRTKTTKNNKTFETEDNLLKLRFTSRSNLVNPEMILLTRWEVVPQGFPLPGREVSYHVPLPEHKPLVYCQTDSYCPSKRNCQATDRSKSLSKCGHVAVGSDKCDM